MFSMIQTGNKSRLTRENSHFYRRQSMKGSWSKTESDRASFSVYWQTSENQVNLRQSRGFGHCPEIHPLLRRSVCTIILAILCIGAGVTVTLFIAFSGSNKISILGVVLMACGLITMIAGSIWYYVSRKQLIQFEKKLTRLRITKIARKFDNANMSKIDRTGQSASKWPKRTEDPPEVTFDLYEEEVQPRYVHGKSFDKETACGSGEKGAVFYGGH